MSTRPATRTPLPDRPLAEAMMRGMAGHCPNCGQGPLFEGFLKVRDTCPVCGEALYHHRADDAPPGADGLFGRCKRAPHDD